MRICSGKVLPLLSTLRAFQATIEALALGWFRSKMFTATSPFSARAGTQHCIKKEGSYWNNFAVCETETSGTEVLDDVPNCKIEQTQVCEDVCEEDECNTVCRMVPQQRCEVSQQGLYSVRP